MRHTTKVKKNKEEKKIYDKSTEINDTCRLELDRRQQDMVVNTFNPIIDNITSEKKKSVSFVPIKNTKFKKYL